MDQRLRRHFAAHLRAWPAEVKGAPLSGKRSKIAQVTMIVYQNGKAGQA
jgi:hypothetical protein